ncbi:hypothetical protein IEQ34_005673 [Dendrobium chrysotoxum]|uniref:Uncharacterized protein n=1 Tax=Dendrobium chrysotoxum TaxID=161865 RepID=A0AAV7GUK0_DENCH|nr:hypothetical protein IEQ34_005673 [Dendrobium chrysotoxum]
MGGCPRKPLQVEPCQGRCPLGTPNEQRIITNQLSTTVGTSVNILRKPRYSHSSINENLSTSRSNFISINTAAAPLFRLGAAYDSKMEEEDDKKNVVKKADPQAEEEDNDSDDCYEIDPIDFTTKLKFSSADDDSVAIVAQKGHVALRDFPHPRHLCGNFPFSRTAHETYCSKCFCYVCEVAAPCSEWWGENGHCNVSRKELEGGPLVALRDFPHPRHLCGNFPFSRTTHETFCSKCFCYVCEVAAPCSEWWGKNGHCNVSQKELEGQLQKFTHDDD